MRATLTPAERGLIERAVASAERRTSAEFVVLIASRSGSYRRAAEVFGTAVGLVVTVAVSLAIPVTAAPGSWFAVRPAPLGLFGTLALLVVSAAAAAWWASRTPSLLRMMTPARERLGNVRRRGAECFRSFRVHTTASRGGVLVYVSLTERMVWVVADDAVSGKVGEGAELWGRVRDRVMEGYRAGKGPEGIAGAVELAAEGLSGVLPPGANDADELSNTVHLLND